MGITGLIPFLKPASRPVNIKEYSGCTVAVDSYCWLHRGAIACAEKIVRGDDTDVFVNYCIKYVDMLLSHNVRPIMVFDGRHLPAKAGTEKSRRERRENNKKKAADLLRQDRPDEARNVMKACIDITPEMAFSLIKRCRGMGVDCIVAPYEADAQLAYLNINGFAHVVITEDSDLLLFGCERVLFKMDLVGNGLLVEQSKLPLAMKVHPNVFSMDKFRHMCILSGCDYLASLPGIGLGKACKFIKRTAETNISRALNKLGAHLNMSNLVVSPDYKEKFLVADSMFKHQPVFDPISRKVVPLTPVPDGVETPQLDSLPAETSFHLALGNLNPLTLERLDDWNPDSANVQKYRTNGWNKGGYGANSIWSKSYVKPKPILPLDRRKAELPPSTNGKIVVYPSSSLEKQLKKVLTKKKPEEEVEELRQIFGIRSPPAKKSKIDSFGGSSLNGSLVIESSDPEDDPSYLNTTSIEDEILGNLDLEDDGIASVDDLLPTSPVLVGNKFIPSTPRNTFACAKKLSYSEPSEKGLAAMSKRSAAVDDDVVCSRFFSSQDSNAENKPAHEGPKIGRMDDDEFNSELDRIINSGAVKDPDEGKKSPSRTIIHHIPAKERAKPLVESVLVSPLAEVSALDKNLSFNDERPSLLNRLDKMSQILSEKSPKKPVASSSYNWQKKKAPTQKAVTSYLAAGSTTTPQKSSLIKPKMKKSTSKPSGVFKNKKPIPQGSLLENFGFKPKPKMSL